MSDYKFKVIFEELNVTLVVAVELTESVLALKQVAPSFVVVFFRHFTHKQSSFSVCFCFVVKSHSTVCNQCWSWQKIVERWRSQYGTDPALTVDTFVLQLLPKRTPLAAASMLNTTWPTVGSSPIEIVAAITDSAFETRFSQVAPTPTASSANAVATPTSTSSSSTKSSSMTAKQDGPPPLEPIPEGERRLRPPSRSGRSTASLSSSSSRKSASGDAATANVAVPGSCDDRCCSITLKYY
jgi:hypothetical protein